jgi:hypothetical protein
MTATDSPRATGLSLATRREMTFFKSAVGDGRKHCDACAVEADERVFLEQDFFCKHFFFLFLLHFICLTAWSKVAAYIGYEGMRRLNMDAYKFATSSE